MFLDIVRKENLPHDKNVDKSKIFNINAYILALEVCAPLPVEDRQAGCFQLYSHQSQPVMRIPFEKR